MKKLDIEIIVGLFIVAGILCMGYTSIKLGQIELFTTNHYPLQAHFTTVAGLKTDTPVEIAGVKVGKVETIHLENYQAMVTMLINKEVKIQDDAIASIRTKGVLGEKYIEILPGGSDVILEPGEVIFDTEPPFDLLTVIKNLALEK